ncbi:MAG: Integral membrane sensor signal transduction histidine kinase [Candidatus Gallionella acididurans]|uniref:histidine kinase n=1 Tax=Candidatus Gallionella acididurans TaxID=1796491 RepID=A0A139BRV3_9PROT|nr:MAG: Integral membrane sensor signal transduction histidine kinase [Candidatus Gallionella acididurans]
MMSHPYARLSDYNCAMNSTILPALPGQSQLQRLVALRSIAIAAQLVTLAAAWKILKLELDWLPMLLTVATLALINLVSWLRLRGPRKRDAAGYPKSPASPLRSSSPVSNPELFMQLCADVIALSILLYFGGGSTNPFVSLYLLPLVIAAATLPGRYTWGMAALTVACYSLLMVYYIPLPHIHFHHDDAFNIHVMGMWLGFVISAAVVAYFVVQMAQAVRSRDEMLARAREEILRNERIVALGTQAAGAAHEMGTPLSTMAVVIGELRHDAPDAQTALHDSLAILDEQVRACKRILDKILANAQDSGAAQPQPADKLMAEVLDEWQLLRPAAQYHYRSDGVQPAPLLSVDVTLRAALMNLLNNAADAGPQAIEIHSHWNSSVFTLEIHDHGTGLSEEAALRAGSAFFTTKTEGRGLGLWLANATIERMGGTVRLFNREEGGATTGLTLPVAGAGT